VSIGRIDNYEYCAQVAAELAPPGGRVLDYGCGAGQIVAKLLGRGVDAYGCDAYFEGNDWSSSVSAELMGSRIRRIENGRIPYEDGWFDVVISNQVMEHVEDLDAVLAEIHRVLMTGGHVLSIFPDKGVWREGHTNVPFMHWLPPGRFRHAYASAVISAGLGYRFGQAPSKAARSSGDYLDRWTHYRTYPAIRDSYRRRFKDLTHIETDWLNRRMGPDHPATRWLPDPVKRFAVRKFAGMALLCVKL
jgi:SAM-dependent methyltransferase